MATNLIRFALAAASHLAFRYCAALLLCASIAQAARAQNFTTLFDFNGNNGSNPYLAVLVQGPDRNLYGTTPYGGKGFCGGYGCGTVFKITPDGTLTTLHEFCANNNCVDGYYPAAGLVPGADGNLYGMTVYGGSDFGTVYKITPAGKLTTVHTFDGRSDGFQPYDALVLANDGNFYGTTQFGGANLLGNVFKMTPRGVVTNLHSFNCSDGGEPYAGLIQGTDGNFYGTTYICGGSSGYGTIFKMTPTGALTTLHVFDQTDGSVISGLVQGNDGNFYGTAGGGKYGYGTIYRITPQGGFTVLYDCNLTDCYAPSQLLLGSDGNFYGTGRYSIFAITPEGTLTVLFSDSSNFYTYAGPAQATDGNLYGTANGGGTHRDGTVWRLELSLGPFVKSVPAAGKVGSKVKILGTHLTGSTSVSFNATAATFAVISATEISASVPAGATTGPLKVVTPAGTLTSSVNFQVLP